MKSQFFILAACLVLALSVRAGDDDALAKDLAAFEGEWIMVSGERDGQPVPPDSLRDARRINRDGETTVFSGGQINMQARYVLDPSKKPKHIDYNITDGPFRGKKQFGIYELNGDTLKLCFIPPANEMRPTDFTTSEGSARTLGTWKRIKK